MDDFIEDEDGGVEGIVDDNDPALDYILYEDMSSLKKPKAGSGCLGTILLLSLLPTGLLLKTVFFLAG